METESALPLASDALPISSCSYKIQENHTDESIGTTRSWKRQRESKLPSWFLDKNYVRRTGRRCSCMDI